MYVCQRGGQSETALVTSGGLLYIAEILQYCERVGQSDTALVNYLSTRDILSTSLHSRDTGAIPELILDIANTHTYLCLCHAICLCAVPELILCAGTNMECDSISGL